MRLFMLNSQKKRKKNDKEIIKPRRFLLLLDYCILQNQN